MMGSKYPQFDRSVLRLSPLADRVHDLHLHETVLPLESVKVDVDGLLHVATSLREARKKKRARILFMGAHVLRSGVQRYLIDLMERGLLSCIAMNGAGVIHDFEFAAIAETTESVAKYIRDGRFGLWQETSRINDIIRDAAEQGLGLGESVGKVIDEEKFPHANLSILAHAYRLGIPVTVHVGVGYDIIHQMPNCDGASLGAASYTDFLIVAKEIENLEQGVIMNFGSAVMGPEVYLKALSMARNVASQRGEVIQNFTSLVCDLTPLPAAYNEEPCKQDPHYYFRPWKTILVRTVADGGTSYYVQGRHEDTLPALWTALRGTA